MSRAFFTRQAAGPRIVAALVLTSIGALCTLSCGSSSAPDEQPSIGTAYVGPLTLNLRKDLASRSAAVGQVKHGDRLDILETRRRFVRVRTTQKIAGHPLEGWTDSNLLLSSQQMDDIERLSEAVAKLPSQGSATVFEPLNVHTESSRQSPSFFQIPEGGSVEVLGHRIAPRVQASAPAERAPRRPVPPKKEKPRDAKAAVAPPPPRPPAPPANLQLLSRPNAVDLPDYVPPAPPPPVALDDWNLVRTRDGKAGWVLARMLLMSIPDEVAQYAERHRITAYLPLSDIQDGDQLKHDWLWTTATPGGAKPEEFDSFRVFVWSKGHHRYETAYIERNVSGHFPVELVTLPGEQEKGFSVVIDDKDGKPYKRTYGFSGYRVRMISKVPAEPSLDVAALLAASGAPQESGASREEARTSAGLWQRAKNWYRSQFQR